MVASYELLFGWSKVVKDHNVPIVLGFELK
jgi:hypothetical protein